MVKNLQKLVLKKERGLALESKENTLKILLDTSFIPRVDTGKNVIKTLEKL